jgi:hypothetical protein
MPIRDRPLDRYFVTDPGPVSAIDPVTIPSTRAEQEQPDPAAALGERALLWHRGERQRFLTVWRRTHVRLASRPWMGTR